MTYNLNCISVLLYIYFVCAVVNGGYFPGRLRLDILCFCSLYQSLKTIYLVFSVYLFIFKKQQSVSTGHTV